LLKDLFFIIWTWAYLLIFYTIVHLFLPLGNSHFLPLNIGYWINFGMIPILLAPFTLFIIYAHIENGTRVLLHVEKFPPIRLYFREKANDFLYNKGSFLFLIDIMTVTYFIRGFHSLMNWVYQVGYLGVRLWLVFILHSFCLGCIQELFTVLLDQQLAFTWIWGGFIGLGLSISLFMVGYVMIQIYVYISFSLSFVFSTVLNWYRTDIKAWNWSKNNITTTTTTTTTTNISNFSKLFPLVPVSLVEVSPTHIYIIVFTVAIIYVLLSYKFMSLTSYKALYLKIRNQLKWESQ